MTFDLNRYPWLSLIGSRNPREDAQRLKKLLEDRRLQNRDNMRRVAALGGLAAMLTCGMAARSAAEAKRERKRAKARGEG